MSNEVGIWTHKSSLADQEPNNAASSVAFLTIILSHKSENKTKPKEKKSKPTTSGMLCEDSGSLPRLQLHQDQSTKHKDSIVTNLKDASKAVD